MGGAPLPAMTNSGSGNQGITCALPVMEYAEYLRCDHDRLVRAVMLSDLIAVHIKSYIGALSAFCGASCAACAPALRLPGCVVARASRLARRFRTHSVTWAASCAMAQGKLCRQDFRCR